MVGNAPAINKQKLFEERIKVLEESIQVFTEALKAGKFTNKERSKKIEDALVYANSILQQIGKAPFTEQQIHVAAAEGAQRAEERAHREAEHPAGPAPVQPQETAEQREEHEREQTVEQVFKKLKTELDALLQKVAGEQKFLKDLQKETFVTTREDQEIKNSLWTIETLKERYAQYKKKCLERAGKATLGMKITPDSLKGEALQEFTVYFNETKKQVTKELDTLIADLKLEKTVEQTEAGTLKRLLQTDAQMQEILQHIDVLSQGLRDAVSGLDADNPMSQHAIALNNLHDPLTKVQEQLQQEDAGIKAVAQAVEKKQVTEENMKQHISFSKQIIGSSNPEKDFNGATNMEKDIAQLHNDLQELVKELQQQDGNLVQVVKQVVVIIKTNVLPVMAEVDKEAKAIQKDVFKDETFFRKLVNKFKPPRPFWGSAYRGAMERK